MSGVLIGQKKARTKENGKFRCIPRVPIPHTHYRYLDLEESRPGRTGGTRQKSRTAGTAEDPLPSILPATGKEVTAPEPFSRADKNRYKEKQNIIINHSR